ncbi:MAG: rRNA maturation RNase YbeY [Alphaproteobacteria bacterium]|nr:rRNA maturation RNase YbeY [Alphaproteobacteria bacterium]
MKKKASARARKSVPPITILVDDKSWRQDKTVVPLLRRAAKTALASMPANLLPVGAEGGLTILLTDDARMLALNAEFRGKKRPTNVLSFTSGEDGAHLGDVALGYGTVKNEAREQGKTLAAHAAHLAAHGVLHLLGYAHEKRADEALMEALETALLAKLGIGDPYAPRPFKKRRKALH